VRLIRLRIPLPLLGAILRGEAVPAVSLLPPDLKILRLSQSPGARGQLELEASSSEWKSSPRTRVPLFVAVPGPQGRVVVERCTRKRGKGCG